MAKRNFESKDNLLVGYVGGSLPLPLQVLVQSHLQMSSENRSIVNKLESAAGMELEGVSPVDFTNRDAALNVILGSNEGRVATPAAPERSSGSMPMPLRDFVGHDIADIPWRTVMPGFREYDMPDVDGCHVSMFWIKPGRTVPAHTHEGFEISLILEGAFFDDRGRFGEGDISVADQSVNHRPTAENERPCIGFAVTDAPLRLTGSLYQRIGDIIGAG